jgi:uncharacterized membrane protein
MKILLRLIRVILIIALCLFSFIWLAFHASSHKIPFETDLFYGLIVGVLIVLNLIFIVIKKKYPLLAGQKK